MKTVSPERVADKIRKLTTLRPQLAIILGSGFKDAIGPLTECLSLPFSKIAGFFAPTVPGHDGQLDLALHDSVPVVVVRGRAHFYEGHSMAEVTFPIRVLAALGVRDILLTNAAGGINPGLQPGKLMLIADHINLMGQNPLRGIELPRHERFVDLTRLYDPTLRKLLLRAARTSRVPLSSGVYLAVSGPSYETPAEIRAFRNLGADAIGMSTVPEAIMARYCGMRVAGLSCITNFAAGIGKGPLSHPDVIETGAKAAEQIRRLLAQFVQLDSKAEGVC